MVHTSSHFDAKESKQVVHELKDKQDCFLFAAKQNERLIHNKKVTITMLIF